MPRAIVCSDSRINGGVDLPEMHSRMALLSIHAEQAHYTVRRIFGAHRICSYWWRHTSLPRRRSFRMVGGGAATLLYRSYIRSFFISLSSAHISFYPSSLSPSLPILPLLSFPPPSLSLSLSLPRSQPLLPPPLSLPVALALCFWVHIRWGCNDCTVFHT